MSFLLILEKKKILHSMAPSTVMAWSNNRPKKSVHYAKQTFTNVAQKLKTHATKKEYKRFIIKNIKTVITGSAVVN